MGQRCYGVSLGQFHGSQHRRCVSGQNKEGTKFYTYAASAVAPFKTKANSAKDVEDFFERFKGLTHQEFLHACFENDSNPFGSSDIVPYKLVCTYLWITK